jgi:hypothetical protein
MFRIMEPSSGDTLTNLILLKYAFYMDPYIVFIIMCYNNLKKYSVLLSLLFNHPYMHRLYFYTALKCIKQVFKPIKRLSTLKIKILTYQMVKILLKYY